MRRAFKKRGRMVGVRGEKVSLNRDFVMPAHQIVI